MEASVRLIRLLPVTVRRGLAVVAALLLAAAASSAQPGLMGMQPPPIPGGSEDQSPEGKVVADIRPQTLNGPSSVPIDKLMGAIRLKVGKPYSQAVVNEDIRRLSEIYSYQDIRVIPSVTGDGKVTVHYQLYVYPNLIREIVYQGAKHIKTTDLDAEIHIQKGTTMNPDANRHACQTIMQMYHDKGRMLARVELLEGGKPNDTRVVFGITEGPVAKIKTTDFVGNTFVSGDRLRTQLNSSRAFLGVIGGTYDVNMVDNDDSKLKEYYQSFGFRDVVVSHETIWDADQRTVSIIFHIHEGPRFHIASVKVVENEEQKSQFKSDDLLRLCDTRPGAEYSQATISADKERLTDYIGHRGIQADIREQVSFDSRPGQATVAFAIQEKPAVRVGQIIIVGNDVTRQNIILRQIPVYPGQILSYPDMRQAEKNLQRLGIFNNSGEQAPHVTVIDPEGDSEFKDLLVTVQEAQTGSLVFGVGVNSSSGLNGNIVLNERNFDISRWPTSWDDLTSGRAFRGAGQEMRISAMPGTTYQQYSATWREPFMFDSPFGLNVSAYYYSRFYLEYTEQRVGTQVNISRQLNPQWSVSTGIRLEDVAVNNVASYAPETFQVVSGNGNVLVGLKANAKYDTRDSFMRPTQGHVVTASFEEVVGDFYFPSATLEGNQYFTLYERADHSGKQVLAIRSIAGVVGSGAPVFERLYAGGFQTFRGFQYRGVGPNDVGFMVGGDFMFLNSMEYQVPVRANDQLYLVGFIDSGTVESSVEIRNYRVTTGFGIRFVLPMFGPQPIALDFGFPIVKMDSDRTQVFSFSMGFFH